jgi:hypothetical protein
VETFHGYSPPEALVLRYLDSFTTKSTLLS